MKRVKGIACGIVFTAMILCMVACGAKDFKAEIQGEWVIYHYYERSENGVDVFLDDTNYYSVTVGADTFSVVAKDGTLENIEGTYEFTRTDEAEVIMNDGTHCTMQIAENSKKHNEDAMWDIYVVETNMYYVLENIKGVK